MTNETGSYVLSNLPIGPYRLEAALPGFRTYAQTGIVLQVNGSPTVNPVLEVGQVTETGRSSANAALVETRNAGVGQVVENARILELPFNGRAVDRAGRAFRSGDACAYCRWDRWQRSFHQGQCFRGRRIEHRTEFHAGRCLPQQSARQRLHVHAVSGCDAGVQSRDQRTGAQNGVKSSGYGESRNEVGHERISRRPV